MGRCTAADPIPSTNLSLLNGGEDDGPTLILPAESGLMSLSRCGEASHLGDCSHLEETQGVWCRVIEASAMDGISLSLECLGERDEQQEADGLLPRIQDTTSG